jgi:hypothetical protein
MMDVNWLAVLAAGVINMIIGSLWYSPLLFLKPWMATLPKKEKENKNINMGKIYGIMFVGALIMAYVMAMFTKIANTTLLDTGAMLGFWIWLGFVGAVQVSDHVWNGKPMQLLYINTSYRLVSTIAMALILTMWV